MRSSPAVPSKVSPGRNDSWSAPKSAREIVTPMGPGTLMKPSTVSTSSACRTCPSGPTAVKASAPP